MNCKLRETLLRAGSLALSIFLTVILCTACGRTEQAAGSEAAAAAPNVSAQPEMPTIPDNAVKYEDEYYVPKEGLQTILMMGLDKFEREISTIAYTNKMQSDFLMLVIIDEKEQVCDLLHLNRDTMTEIPMLGLKGANTGSLTGQLALAHTYGSGGSDSCINAVRAVSGFLKGIKIDHYMTLTMDGVGKLNDMVGGVTLTLMDDLTEYDPAMVQGAEMTLKGDQALYYVRARKDVGDNTNLRRMERQRQYLEEFYNRLMEKNRQDDEFLASAVMKIGDDFETDCTVNQLDKLSDLMEICTVRPIVTIPGEAVQGEEFIEFYADEEALAQTVINLFYEPWSEVSG